ncbi:hypothetical protein [Microbispora triticiradicis]|uniref:hypothetical protein n=1 Tax=Microbispora triticiradicis TaxID=2200763 RepID=UPI0027DB7E46|nr:hypothetical protein [Microbispora triticiradicis]
MTVDHLLPVELRYPSGETQPATGDPDGVSTPFISSSRTIVRLHLRQRADDQGHQPLHRPVTPGLLPSTSSCSGQFVVMQVLPLPGQTVLYDARNTSPSGPKCLLRRTQIFGAGRGSLSSTSVIWQRRTALIPRRDRPEPT